MSPPDLVLFDPYAGGHHAEHIRRIAEAWHTRGERGHLLAAVAPALLASHPSLSSLAYENETSSVAFVPLEGAEELEKVTSLREIGRINGRLLQHTIAEHRPKRVLLMYLDHLQLALATGRPFSPPVELSGILFRPELHYAELGDAPTTWRARVRDFRKRLVLRAALRHRQLTHVFSLDPTAVPSLQRLARRARAVHLPDPALLGVAAAHPPDATRRDWGVEPGRVLALLFGSMDGRKGADRLLEALLRIPEDTAERLAVIVAGRSRPDIRPQLEALAARVHSATAVQLIVRDAFLPDDEIQALIEASDVILAPYQRHVGSSGVVMRAAAAGHPLLSQDYGLMGHQVRSAGLGWAIDTTDADAIARTLAASVAGPPAGYDPERACAFAAPYTEEAYLDTLLSNLLTLPEA